MKIGITGCGRVTETCHLKALKYINKVEKVELSDNDLLCLKRLAKKFNIKDTSKTFGTFVHSVLGGKGRNGPVVIFYRSLCLIFNP
jgi:predicted dehydrogenase